MSVTPFSLGTRILATGAALLFLFLGVGFALPGTWSAERTVVLSAAPGALYPLVEAPAAWRAWSEWPEQGLVPDGPERGVGARLSWDDPELGNGSFEIVEAVPQARVRYRVEVEGGSMRTEGTFLLAPEGAGTRVTWTEEGDFGWNPLMGYWARLMERAQGRELERALRRLDAMALEAEAPADAGSAGARPQSPDSASR